MDWPMHAYGWLTIAHTDRAEKFKLLCYCRYEEISEATQLIIAHFHGVLWKRHIKTEMRENLCVFFASSNSRVSALGEPVTAAPPALDDSAKHLCLVTL